MNYFSNAIGTAVEVMSGLSKIVFQSAMNGHVNGVLSGLDGGSYQQCFFSGGGGSIVSSMVSGLVISNVPGLRGISTVATGGISVGIISYAWWNPFGKALECELCL